MRYAPLSPRVVIDPVRARRPTTGVAGSTTLRDVSYLKDDAYPREASPAEKAQLGAAARWHGTPLAPADMPLSLYDSYREMAFAGYQPRGGYAFDDMSEWRAIADWASAAADSLLPLIEDPALRAAETSHAQKIPVSWRLVGLGVHVQRGPLTVYSEMQAANLTNSLRRYGVWAASVIRANPAWARVQYDSGAVPMDRGKAWPWYFAGTIPDVGLALYRIAHKASSVHALDQRLSTAAPILIPRSFTAYLRVQSGKKPRDTWMLDGSWLVPDPIQRRLSKTRLIAAPGWQDNALEAGPANLMLAILRSTRENCGKVAVAAAAAREWRYSVALDVREHDAHFSLQTLNAIRQLVTIPSYNAMVDVGLMTAGRRALLIELDTLRQTAPILCPPHNLSWGAELVATAGRNKSGERGTTVKSTLGQRVAISSAARRVGLKPHQYFAMNSGDDTIAFCNDAKHIDMLTKGLSELGLWEYEREDVPTFLMRKIPEGFVFFFRQLNACLQKEVGSEPRNELVAALGIATRWRLLAGHPLHSSFLPLLSTCPSERVRRAAAIAATALDDTSFAALGQAAASSSPGIEFRAFLAARDAADVPDAGRVLSHAALEAAARAVSDRWAFDIVRKHAYTTSRERRLSEAEMRSTGRKRQ